MIFLTLLCIKTVQFYLNFYAKNNQTVHLKWDVKRKWSGMLGGVIGQYGGHL